jgi:hypothetical protein
VVPLLERSAGSRLRDSIFVSINLRRNQKAILFYGGVAVGSVATGVSFYVAVNYGSPTYLVITKSEMKEILEKGIFGVFRAPKGDLIVASVKGFGELRELIIDETLANVAQTA